VSSAGHNRPRAPAQQRAGPRGRKPGADQLNQQVNGESMRDSSTSKKPLCPMTRTLHRPITRVRLAS
jgi:hypothetical protein